MCGPEPTTLNGGKRIRYNLNFNRRFGYSVTWRKGDRQKNIDKLKEDCLNSVRNSLRHLSQLRDEQLLGILEEEEWDD